MSASAQAATVFDPRFVRHAVHALRAPLQTIHGFAYLLTQDMPGDSFDQALGLIREDSARLMAMLDDLGWRGRIAAGDLALDRRACDLSALLSRLALIFEHEHVGYFIDLRPTALPIVTADEDRVVDVLTAVLRQAARTSPPGRLRVSARGGPQVVVACASRIMRRASRPAIASRSFAPINRCRAPGAGRRPGSASTCTSRASWRGRWVATWSSKRPVLRARDAAMPGS